MRLFILSPEYLYCDEQGYLSHIFSSPRLKVVGAAIYQLKPRKKAPIIKWMRKVIQKLWEEGIGYISRTAGVKIYYRFVSRVHNTGKVQAESYFREKEIPLLATSQRYAGEVIEFIRAKEPEAIFRMRWGIIKEPLLSLAPKGIVSYHHGDIRKYRGIPPCFWPMYNAETEMKVTVQILSEGVDCGSIVKEKVIPIYKSDTHKVLNRRAYTRTYSMATEACELLDNDQFMPQKLSRGELFPLYTYPTLRQWIIFFVRVNFRRFKWYLIKR